MGAENVNRVGHEPEGLPVPNRAPKGAKPAAALHRFVTCSASECRVDIDVTRENGRFPRGRMAGPAGFEPATVSYGEIGRASCRERVFSSGYLSGVAVRFKKKR